MTRITIKQAAELMGVHPETIKVWIRKGILPDRRPKGAKKYFIFREDLNL